MPYKIALVDLEPEFLKIESPKSFRMDATFQDNDGLFLLCPECFTKNKGNVGTHGVICWKPNVPQTMEPKPGRWSQTGSGFGDLSLVAGSSSVLLTAGCNAHFFIRNGIVTNA